MSWVAVAIGGSAVVGGVASNMAADKQAGAAGKASGQIANQYNQTRRDLMPWVGSGQIALDQLQQLSGLHQGSQPRVDGPNGYWTRPGGVPDQWMPTDPNNDATASSFDPNAPLVKPFGLSDFKESPGYQFNLQQGQDAINKASSARGNYYAPSTLQDIGRYSQGLASNEFNNAYGQYNNNQNNIWNRLFDLSSAGQSAANQTGAFGANAANQIGQNTVGAGNAGAAGIMGTGNAIQGGIQNAYWQYLANQQAPTYGGANSTPSYGAVPGI